MGLKLISGTTQLVSTQLLGSGRLTLMMVPAMALVLAGPVVAIHFVILCSAVIGTTIILVTNGIIEPTTIYNGIVPAEYLFLQGKMWLVEVFPHLYLMGHFLFLHEKTLVAVSDARKQLDEESDKNRKLELEMHRIAEQERQKLGAELHDGLCQHLTATLLKCSSLIYVMKEEEKPEFSSVEKIRNSVEKSISLAYQISRGLVPVRIEPDALIPALQELCLAKWTESNIECNFVAEADAQIAIPETALQLYRIASEAINNAVKHSGCSVIRVKISNSDSEFFLEISDNGKGINEDPGKPGGMGLSIMEYRAGLIGGALEARNNYPEGFTVICRLPLAKL
jgi:signal transduction histidine kinase